MKIREIIDLSGFDKCSMATKTDISSLLDINLAVLKKSQLKSLVKRIESYRTRKMGGFDAAYGNKMLNKLAYHITENYIAKPKQKPVLNGKNKFTVSFYFEPDHIKILTNFTDTVTDQQIDVDLKKEFLELVEMGFYHKMKKGSIRYYKPTELYKQFKKRIKC